ncbi:glycoside hydrolase family 57 protein [Thiomicrorhabdus lithotrophica]|uniref:Glycoside hydrolase family 57 protein n=1 Tax=Thiomicrorhabdus lithotrophica TaxID=2949997 RepID=A0ABY8CB12_9GAMM|nr:glycoside hydrolase family 57 protein [Thiomicrorhabdus lithotrophica]WEJ63124.1 glycoside hydrolase family 57 protein [Thiomicrorhabdus lithotrophica]
MDKKKIKVVLCWHMHQPHYRDGLDGVYRLPWVYLHAIKDYSDMVWHLENCPEAKVVVNFAPVLLEQLDDYEQQMRAWLGKGVAMQDPLLNLAAGLNPIPQTAKEREEIVAVCQRAYAPTMINVLPAFRELVDMVECNMAPHRTENVCVSYLNDQYFTDLLVWYHLAWMGESLRHSDERVDALMDKRNHYTIEDQRILIEIIADCVGSIIPRYKALMERGQIEISMTPYGHPIVPLLIDFKSMRDALPDAPAPAYAGYPDGYERSKWHMEHGLKVYQQHFDTKPEGVWLSEGAISSTAVGLLDEYGFKWTASGEGVWRHSCEASCVDQHDYHSKKALYQPLQLASQKCAMFFRDDGLSDMVGFQYKDWHPTDAANDFAQHMENIANFLGDRVEEHVVSVILDGENAWEYYFDNASHFLKEMYSALSNHPRVEMTTFSDALESGAKIRHLPILKAGSWVYGSFSTWIGDEDKNRAWDLLVEAKQCFDEAVATEALSAQEVQQATEQLAICEGSDWFWWFGGYNPSDSVQDFDNLYRRHLKRLYQLLNKTPPTSLEIPISLGGGDMENSGTMRRN